MSRTIQQALAAMEKPGELKNLTIKELWVLFSFLKDSEKSNPQMLDRIRENIFMLIKKQLDQYKKGKTEIIFAEALQLLLDFPDHLETTKKLAIKMKQVECSLFNVAFEMATTTENFVDLLEEATEKNHPGEFLENCKKQAVNAATTTKDQNLLQKMGLLSAA